MEKVKDLCREMAENPHILTFSEIAKAAADGVLIGQKVHNPLAGLVLNVSLQAGRRAVLMTEELIRELLVAQEEAKNPKPRPKQ